MSRVKDQGRTKEEPTTNLRNNRSSTREIRTPKQEKSSFIKIAVSFPSLIPCLILPREERETTDRTPTQLPAHKKCCFLRLLPNKVVLIPKKVDSFPKTVDYIPKIVTYPPNKKSHLKTIFSCSIQNNSLPLRHYTKIAFVNLLYLCTAKQENTCRKTKTQ